MTDLAGEHTEPGLPSFISGPATKIAPGVTVVPEYIAAGPILRRCPDPRQHRIVVGGVLVVDTGMGPRIGDDVHEM